MTRVVPAPTMVMLAGLALSWPIVINIFLLIFGISNINKVAIAAFGALLIVLFNSAYGVINARKQRVMAAKVMGATRWQSFRKVVLPELSPALLAGIVQSPARQSPFVNMEAARRGSNFATKASSESK